MYRRSGDPDVRMATALAAVAVVGLIVLVLASVVFAQSEESPQGPSVAPQAFLPPVKPSARPLSASTSIPTSFPTIPDRAPTPTRAPAPTSTATPSPTPEDEEIILSSIDVPTRTPRSTPPVAGATPASATAPRTPTPPKPTPAPTETPQQRLIKLALQVLNMQQPMTHSMLQERLATDLELEISRGDCVLYVEIKEFANEEFVLSSSAYQYRDAGCDAKLDVVWTDKYRARSTDKEAAFLVEDEKYRRWLVTMAQHEGLLK